MVNVEEAIEALWHIFQQYGVTLRNFISKLVCNNIMVRIFVLYYVGWLKFDETYLCG